jgi:hypothetical protein
MLVSGGGEFASFVENPRLQSEKKILLLFMCLWV